MEENKQKNEALNPGDIIWAPRSSPTWPVSLGVFNYVIQHFLSFFCFFGLGQFQIAFYFLPSKQSWQILHEFHLWANLLGETNIKRNITGMSAGHSWPSEVPVTGSDVLIPGVWSSSRGYFLFPETCSFLSPSVCTWGWGCPICIYSTSTQSRTWILSTSQHAQEHWWVTQTHLKSFKGRWGSHSAHPQPSASNYHLTLLVIPKSHLSCPSGREEADGASIADSSLKQCPVSWAPLSLVPAPSSFAIPNPIERSSKFSPSCRVS